MPEFAQLPSEGSGRRKTQKKRWDPQRVGGWFNGQKLGVCVLEFGHPWKPLISAPKGHRV